LGLREIGDVDEAVSGIGHELNDFRDGVLVIATNLGLRES
jgi:hypothetical protein